MGNLRSSKKRPGPAEFVFDLEQIEGLARIHCTDEEIASVVGCHVDTITVRKKNDPAFLEVMQRGKGNGRMVLRRMQWQRAKGGSDTMLIWLGKQLLGQKDRETLNIGNADGTPFLVGVVTGVPRGDETD
jgi:hypothetical protein